MRMLQMVIGFLRFPRYWTSFTSAFPSFQVFNPKWVLCVLVYVCDCWAAGIRSVLGSIVRSK